MLKKRLNGFQPVFGKTLPFSSRPPRWRWSLRPKHTTRVYSSLYSRIIYQYIQSRNGGTKRSLFVFMNWRWTRHVFWRKVTIFNKFSSDAKKRPFESSRLSLSSQRHLTASHHSCFLLSADINFSGTEKTVHLFSDLGHVDLGLVWPLRRWTQPWRPSKCIPWPEKDSRVPCRGWDRPVRQLLAIEKIHVPLRNFCTFLLWNWYFYWVKVFRSNCFMTWTSPEETVPI